MENLRARLRVIIAGALVIIAMLVVQFGFETEEAVRPVEVSAERSVDFFVSNAIVTRWDPQGLRRSSTTAEYAEHFDQRDLMELDFPYSVGFNDDQTVSHTLSAVTGWIPDDNIRIDLAGKVELHHNPGEAQSLSLFTEKLSYFTDSGLVQTDSDVEIVSESGETTATGMDFFTRESRMELLSNVRGNYVPSR